jgi:hypothetical protein
MVSGLKRISGWGVAYPFIRLKNPLTTVCNEKFSDVKL